MKTPTSAITVILACLASSSALAHHSTSAEFDMSRTVAIMGTICKAELSNPHTYVYVHVKLANGQSETWKMELPGAARLSAQGVPGETFKVGESITVQAYPSKAQPSFDPAEGAIYGACPNQPGNTLRVGHVREARLATGKQVQISDQWPETVTIRQ